MKEDLGTTTSSILSNQPTGDQRVVFAALMSAAASLLEQAVGVAGIHSLRGQHALACANLAKIKMHEVRGEAEGDDFRALHGNMTDMARAIDPLIEMIGEEAADNATRIFDRELFKETLFGAIDGNALYELTNAADNADEDAAEDGENDRADHHYKLEREAVL